MSVNFCDECGGMMKQINDDWVCENCSSEGIADFDGNKIKLNSSSRLESIDSVGSARADALRSAGYQDISDIQAATQSELQRVKGIGSTLASRIKCNAGNTPTNENTRSSKSNKLTSSSNDKTEDKSTEDIEQDSSIKHIRTAAETAVTTAEEAERDGNFEEARREYKKALDQYETAKYEFELEDENFSPPVTEAIDQVSNQLENVEKLQNKRTKLIDSLQTAERRFQEGIVAYVESDQLLSRIRFRQARDEFGQLINIIESSEVDLLISSITVTIDFPNRLSSKQIDSIDYVGSEALSIMEKKGMKKITDLQTRTNLLPIPLVLADLAEKDLIEKQTQNKLSVLSWYNENAKLNLEKKEQLTQRKKCAQYGFEACR